MLSINCSKNYIAFQMRARLENRNNPSKNMSPLTNNLL